MMKLFACGVTASGCARLFVGGLVLIGAISVFFTSAAEAKIRCNGPFQVIRGGGQHATPYCEDNYLAAIARRYGMRVSNRAVRNNPSTKAEVCRFIGHDARLRLICGDYGRPDWGRQR